MSGMTPKVCTVERFCVDIRDHFLGISILELEDVVVPDVAEMFIKELNAYAVGSAEVPHRGVFARFDDLNARLVIFVEDAGVSGRQEGIPEVEGWK